MSDELRGSTMAPSVVSNRVIGRNEAVRRLLILLGVYLSPISCAGASERGEASSPKDARLSLRERIAKQREWARRTGTVGAWAEFVHQCVDPCVEHKSIASCSVLCAVPDALASACEAALGAISNTRHVQLVNTASAVVFARELQNVGMATVELHGAQEPFQLGVKYEAIPTKGDKPRTYVSDNKVEYLSCPSQVTIRTTTDIQFDLYLKAPGMWGEELYHECSCYDGGLGEETRDFPERASIDFTPVLAEGKLRQLQEICSVPESLIQAALSKSASAFVNAAFGTGSARTDYCRQMQCHCLNPSQGPRSHAF